MKPHHVLIVIVTVISIVVLGIAITERYGKNQYTKGIEEGYKQGHTDGYMLSKNEDREVLIKANQLMDRAIESLNNKEWAIIRLEDKLRQKEELLAAYERRWEKDHPIRKVPNEQKNKRDD